MALAPLGGLFSQLLTHTHFSVCSCLGFLALIGVSVEISFTIICWSTSINFERAG